MLENHFGLINCKIANVRDRIERQQKTVTKTQCQSPHWNSEERNTIKTYIKHPPETVSGNAFI